MGFWPARGSRAIPQTSGKALTVAELGPLNRDWNLLGGLPKAVLSRSLSYSELDASCLSLVRIASPIPISNGFFSGRPINADPIDKVTRCFGTLQDHQLMVELGLTIARKDLQLHGLVERVG